MDALNEYPGLRDALVQRCVVDGADEVTRLAEGVRDHDRIGIDIGRLWQDLNHINECFQHE